MKVSYADNICSVPFAIFIFAKPVGFGNMVWWVLKNPTLILVLTYAPIIVYIIKLSVNIYFSSIERSNF
jgi:hypothetical protein